MQCLTRSPEHQSGCVPSDSPQMLYGSLWICFRSLAQKPAQPFLHHVVWIMQELDGVLRFLGKTFFAASLELTRRRPPSDSSVPETLPCGIRVLLEPDFLQFSAREGYA